MSEPRGFSISFGVDFATGKDCVNIKGIPADASSAHQIGRLMEHNGIESIEGEYRVADEVVWLAGISNVSVGEEVMMMGVVAQILGLHPLVSLPVWANGDWEKWGKWAKKCESPYGGSSVDCVKVFCHGEKEDVWIIS